MADKNMRQSRRFYWLTESDGVSKILCLLLDLIFWVLFKFFKPVIFILLIFIFGKAKID